MGIALKPFLPQLQTTFLKALQDSSRAVRLRAAEALGQLVSIHTKVDPLFTEQLSAIRNAEDSGVRCARRPTSSNLSLTFLFIFFQ